MSNSMEKKTALTKQFQDFFQVELASTQEKLKQVYSVRYRVYCEEFGYEDTALFPTEMETDEFDNYSTHCLIIHKATQRPAACVRLVPAIVKGEDKFLPLEKCCDQALYKDKIKEMKIDRNKACEISRLAVDGVFRRRSGESLTRFGDIDININFSDAEQRTFPIIAVAAFLSAKALTALTGKTNMFAMMEPFLPRLLKRSGLLF
ncbi:MAG: PEP-CTERM/exosortase system-associated acyltransferase, partial [Gammaproteobacteria bacterium]|nr:PEP-CTERM/exosortase system-associated acyltransferase [Gammaproteobacteria bacterium]